ncbi:MAG: NUDIX hydrolase [Caldilineaceae bacterium]
MRDGNYQYCPYCANALQLREIYRLQRPVCPKCGFVHFADPKVAVIGLVTQNAQVLLIQRAINPEKGKWALPGGYMDAGELPEAALRREVWEEVQLAIRVTELLTIFPMITNRVHSQGIVLAYRAEVADRNQIALTAADDAGDAGWFHPDQLPTALAFASTQTLLAEWCEELAQKS